MSLSNVEKWACLQNFSLVCRGPLRNINITWILLLFVRVFQIPFFSLNEVITPHVWDDFLSTVVSWIFNNEESTILVTFVQCKENFRKYHTHTHKNPLHLFAQEYLRNKILFKITVLDMLIGKIIKNSKNYVEYTNFQ